MAMTAVSASGARAKTGEGDPPGGAGDRGGASPAATATERPTWPGGMSPNPPAPNSRGSGGALNVGALAIVRRAPGCGDAGTPDARPDIRW
jgi:hypothetical protein